MNFFMKLQRNKLLPMKTKNSIKLGSTANLVTSYRTTFLTVCQEIWVLRTKTDHLKQFLSCNYYFFHNFTIFRIFIEK